MPVQRFVDRADAGRRLAEALTDYAPRPDLMVLGLPRGGVPVAAQVALWLGVPLDILLVRKLSVPRYPELALGAIAEDGVVVLDDELIRDLQLSRLLVEQVTRHEQAELARQDREYRGDRSRPTVAGHTVVVVDDGVATGATMEAAIVSLRQRQAAEIVVAVPVGAPEACERLRRLADVVVCASMPVDLRAVGRWYDHFAPTTDGEVRRLLDSHS